jgi:asparagine N-glycosylation enzyme membrane subunit Stt3
MHLQVSAWGGYVFIINLIPLHVFTLLVMGRYSNRLFTSYTTFYILGLLLSMQIPFVGFQPIRTSEHMAASGNVFSFCQPSLFCWVTSTLQSVKERIYTFCCSLFSSLTDIML